ncbi:MAG: four helix bundle protein [Candidatus Bilamarchaeaceae archaeon]
MAVLKRFEELECWQEARKLVNLIYSLCKNDLFKTDYELMSQIKRSAISSMANIAEGFHRNSNKEFMKFLDYSRASIAETISHCFIALDQGYITESEMKRVNELANILWKKVNNLISYLNKKVEKP